MLKILQQGFNNAKTGCAIGRICLKKCVTNPATKGHMLFRPSSHVQRRTFLTVSTVYANRPANTVQSFGTTMPLRRNLQFTSSDILGFISKVSEIIIPVHTKVLAPDAPHPTIERPLELKKLKKAVEKVKGKNGNETAILYVTGEPGVGKTQLAKMYAKDYYTKWTPSSKTVLTIDMNDFQDSYRKVAIELDNSNSGDTVKEEDFSTIAGKIKKTLRERRDWLLIVDNYNSIDCSGIDRGILENHLLPLRQPINSDWGKGTVLVTTHNAGVIPSTPHVSTVTIDPLSIEESLNLIRLLALGNNEKTSNYLKIKIVGGSKIKEGEKRRIEAEQSLELDERILMETTTNKEWRNLPPVMSRIGNYMRVRRKQTESHSMSYSFRDYLRELERGETEDPEEPNRADVESALQEMMKSSDALQKTFRLLAVCPQDEGIPLAILERLMKKYDRKVFAHKRDEIDKCTIINTYTPWKTDWKCVKSHRFYTRMMQNIPMLTNTEEQLFASFIDCLTEEAHELYAERASTMFTRHKLRSLHQLLNAFSNRGR